MGEGEFLWGELLFSLRKSGEEAEQAGAGEPASDGGDGDEGGDEDGDEREEAAGFHAVCGGIVCGGKEISKRRSGEVRGVCLVLLGLWWVVMVMGKNSLYGSSSIRQYCPAYVFVGV